MAVTTSTTTAVELSPLPPLANSSGHNRFHNEVANDAQNPSSEDILEASRLADSAVPDGGYGWVVLGGCAVIAWWVSSSVYMSVYKKACFKRC